ncbi:hypothetical protein DSCA_44550 [Desulfosarcina alkanivorans]|uniref:DUF5610 domain-containing protein n=1 Tax=Desulfosarcina alkanivorans TaxID=571177 RepID=A0A5K7YQC3_9BACT|nr:hypothetical protein [Desulfosarcina alkanivorans]BBO70525.1 hypothetical protein DSCA_44550 [Desulfosarcina alkanivorans]
MNPIANQQSFAPFSRGAFAGGRSFQAEQTRVGTVSMAQNTDLTITTDEGDTVTISLASAMEATAGIYRSRSYEGGRAASSQTAFFEFSGNRNMTVAVDGTLNEGELEDIREAVSAIGSMIDDFMNGDLQEMAEDGELLKELDTISSLEAAFSYERQVMHGQQEKVDISGSAPGKGRHARRHGQGRLQRLLDRIDRMTDDMAEQVKGFRGRRRQLATSVEDLFGRYRSGEAGNAAGDELGRDVIRTMQSAFVQKIQTLNESASFNLTYTR